MKSKIINMSDVKFFAAHALTGLSSNPYLMGMEGKRYMEMKKMSIEGIAVESALMMVERLHLVELTFNKVEEAESAKEKKENGTHIESAPDLNTSS